VRLLDRPSCDGSSGSGQVEPCHVEQLGRRLMQCPGHKCRAVQLLGACFEDLGALGVRCRSCLSGLCPHVGTTLSGWGCSYCARSLVECNRIVVRGARVVLLHDELSALLLYQLSAALPCLGLTQHTSEPVGPIGLSAAADAAIVRPLCVNILVLGWLKCPP
jgi:hypothetical protein